MRGEAGAVRVGGLTAPVPSPGQYLPGRPERPVYTVGPDAAVGRLARAAHAAFRLLPAARRVGDAVGRAELRRCCLVMPGGGTAIGVRRGPETSLPTLCPPSRIVLAHSTRPRLHAFFSRVMLRGGPGCTRIALSKSVRARRRCTYRSQGRGFTHLALASTRSAALFLHAPV